MVLEGEAQGVARLLGSWTALGLARDPRDARRLLRQIRASGIADWRLDSLTGLDHVGAQALWRAWGRSLPTAIVMSDTQREIFERIAALDHQSAPWTPPRRPDPITALGLALFVFVANLRDGIVLLGGFVIDVAAVIRRPRQMPWRELSAYVYAAGARALGITALVGFLLGIVLGYLSAQQLQTFGASAFIVNILGLSIVRELGPVIAAILVAGRSGSAITAQLGVMRLTEELDAMRVMGISTGRRLILPRVLALAIAMPLLVMWTDIVALIGGMVASQLVLGIDFHFFVSALQRAVPIANLYIGLGKGLVFGVLIALVGCHFGLRIKPNSQSLGDGTTVSVVTSITTVIIADAVFAILFSKVGLR
ncbi:phospholipid/cholesterol/gamma-HCH transport system permease protein [Chitinasiproducens palmae]|uniref:Phospholipid/cholesterol/gamma-HCH transport system permease protein n=1 Tax=Chitinasiproducens palmae TaxID=1770053 RepID=A0A1H2PNW5_9BURK|nr:ABC transporter permease [Chitinasiproducens palmae]SDV48365.1 phospholipid/cholesterol/gamma-HCH transport system permease protein [Chitinasiproducens palmae]